MKGKTNRFSRILVFLLCAILAVSNMGITTFAENEYSCEGGHYYVEGVCAVCGAQEYLDDTIGGYEPVYDEPVYEEPVIDEPVIDEPVIDEPVIDEPVIDEPVIDEPVIDEPVIDEPVIDEPVIDEPIIDEPVVDEPAIDEPIIDEPIIDVPVIDEPIIDEPVIDEPVINEPIIDEPIVNEPVPDTPVLDEPVVMEPDTTLPPTSETMGKVPVQAELDIKSSDLKEKSDPCAEGHNYVDGVCTRCGEAEEPTRDGDPVQEYTITFVANGGTGEMANVTVAEGESYTLPDNGFIAPYSKVFENWQVGSTYYNRKDPGDSITITEDTTIIANWIWQEGTWKWLEDELNKGGMVVLDRDYTAGAQDGHIEIRRGTEVTLDLNGHTIRQTTNDAIIMIYGSLTLNDSMGYGLLTGGERGVFLSAETSNSTVSFIMNGGTISDISGQGVGMTANPNATNSTVSFIMNGGTITNNLGGNTNFGGALTVFHGSTGAVGNHFIVQLNGGSITNNHVNNSGGAIYVDERDPNGRLDFSINGCVIHGNSAANDGGAIYIEALTGSNFYFTLESGGMYGNYAGGKGGGLYLKDINGTNPAITISGGFIDTNTATEGAGVYVEGSLCLSGDPYIFENYDVNDENNNIYLPTGKVIYVTDDLSEYMYVGITMQTPGVFTSGLPGRGTLANFEIDNLLKTAGLDSNGEAYVYEPAPVTVSFIPGEGGSGEMADIQMALGRTFYLPECDFTAPEGYNFAGWQIGDDTTNLKDPYDDIVVTEDTTITAIWEMQSLNVSFEANGGSGSMDGFVADYGDTYTLPANSFTAPENRQFYKWKINDDYDSLKEPGDTITITEDIVITAVWKNDVSSWSELQDSLNNGGKITLQNDVIATADDSYLLIPYGKDVFLDLNGHTIDRGLQEATSDGYVLCVKGTLVLDDSGNNGLITGGYNSSNLSGGVYVYYGAHFTMNGGEISSNRNVQGSGGGVYMSTYASFIMNDGVIADNSAGFEGGGVYIGHHSSFLMNGGVITDNSAATQGGGISIAQNSGSFTMNGGEISDNYAALNGGGICVNPYSSFVLNDGDFSGNCAKHFGGGVYVDGGDATMNGGTITENTIEDIGYDGGGVYVGSGTFTMNDGEISNNIGYEGGGVYVSHGSFTMNDGEIINNHSSYQGGGVFIRYPNTFAMNGGEISGNSADSRGGGIYAGDNSFSLSGNPTITANTVGDTANNVYLYNGDAYIIVTDELTNETPIGISTNNLYSGLVFTSGLPGYGDESNFICDDTEYDILLDTYGEAMIATLCTVSFDANGGSGEMEPEYAAQYCEYTLPECGFTSPSVNKPFGGWLIYSEYDNRYYVIRAGDTCYVEKDLVLLAWWKNEWDLLQDTIDEVADNDEGGTVVLTKDYTAEAGNWPLEIPENVTLDLHGYSITAAEGMEYAVAAETGSIIDDSIGGGAINGGICVTNYIEPYLTLSGNMSIDRIDIYDRDINDQYYSPNYSNSIFVDSDFSSSNAIMIRHYVWSDYEWRYMLDAEAFTELHDKYMNAINNGASIEKTLYTDFAFAESGNAAYFYPEYPNLFYITEVMYNGDQRLALCPNLAIKYDENVKDLSFAVHSNLSYASPGDTVTLTPDVACEINGLRAYYYYNDGEEYGIEMAVTLTPQADGTYTFIMPERDVIITANDFSLADDCYLIQVNPGVFRTGGGGWEEKSASAKENRGVAYNGEEVVWAITEVNGVRTNFAKEGDEVVFTIVCKEGFGLKDIQIHDEEYYLYKAYALNEDQYSLIMPGNDVICDLTGDGMQPISVSVEHGTITIKRPYKLASGGYDYLDTDFMWQSGDTLYLYVEAEEDYALEMYSIDLIHQYDGNYTYGVSEADFDAGIYRLNSNEIPGPVTVTANFVPVETTYYDLSFEQGFIQNEHVTGAFIVDDEPVDRATPGLKVFVSLTPEEGWEVSYLQTRDSQYSGGPTLSYEGENEWSFIMPTTSITVNADVTPIRTQNVSTWQELQSALQEGGTITLENDITYDNYYSHLYVDSNKVAVLNMNGHTITLGLYNFNVYGTLTINGGVINGHMEASNSSILTLNGCEITGCLGILPYSKLILTGKNKIHDIGMNHYDDYSYIINSVITIDSGFVKPDVPIIVNMSYPSVYTSGWAAWSEEHPGVYPHDCFSASAQGNCIQTYTDDGELCLTRIYDIQFSAGIGYDNGEMDEYWCWLNYGDPLVLPECYYVGPDDRPFKAWLVGDRLYNPGDEIIITDDITVTALWKEEVFIEAYAVDENDNSMGDIGITPDEILYEGDEVTLTAPLAVGYEFLGWFSYDGTLVCGTLVYTFSIEEDTFCLARYKAREKASVTISVGNGAQFRIGTSSAIQDSADLKVSRGSTLTITAVEPDKVLQWQNKYGMVLGREGSLTITVMNDLDIKLMYNTPYANQSFVQFISDYGQILTYRQYTSSDEIDFPVFPSKYGYDFTGWVFDGTSDEATQQAISAKISAGNDPVITIKPSYVPANTAPCTVTVEYVHSEGMFLSEDISVTYGAGQTFTARSFDGYRFECWKINGEIVGYNESYRLKVSDDITLTAYYVLVTESVEVEPLITISDLYTVDANGVHKVSGQITRNIPDGYTLVEHGALYARNPYGGLDEDIFICGSSNPYVKQYVADTTALCGVLTVNLKVDTDEMDVWMRGYMILLNESTGNEQTFYTRIVHGSFNNPNIQ